MTCLVDTAFLRRYFAECFSENVDMVKTKRRYTRDDRLWDNIRTIVFATDTNFEYCRVDL